MRGRVAVKVFCFSVSESRRDANGDTVLDVRAKKAIVRVVGGAEEYERRIRFEDVPVRALPVTVRISRERRIDLQRLQVMQRRGLNRGGTADDRGTREPLQEGAACLFVLI